MPVTGVDEHPSPPRHCVVETLPLDVLARGVPTPVRCHPTMTALLSSMGLTSSTERGIDASEGVRRLLGSGVALAVHHQDAGAGGGLLAVTGTCEGSGLNMPGGFNDVMSSTRHQACGRIKHFSDANGGGDHQITEGAAGAVVNMNGSLNDRVSSTYYYAS
jgi:hypothetical protein